MRCSEHWTIVLTRVLNGHLTWHFLAPPGQCGHLPTMPGTNWLVTMHSAWHQQTMPGTSWLFRAHTDYAGHQLIIPCTYLLTMPGTSWLCIAQQQGSQSSADQLWNVMVGIHNSRLIKVFTGAKNFVKVFLLKNLPDCWSLPSLPSLSLPARPDCIHECIHGFFIFVCVSIPPGVRNA